MAESRTCPRCKESKPLDRENFGPNAGQPSGFEYYCRPCKRQHSKECRAKRRLHSNPAWDNSGQTPALGANSFPDGVVLAEPKEIPPPVIIDDRPIPGEGLPREGLTTVVALPDIHFPFHSERWFRLALELVGDLKPGLVIQLGDLYDLLSFSKYPRSFNVTTPADEINEARALAESMWATIRHRAPDAKCVQLRGNHDDRANKRVAESLPAIESLVQPVLSALFAFDGVLTVDDTREEFEFEGVLYHHGHRRFGQHVSWNLQSTVNGHLHTGGVVFKQTERQTIWELNAGFGGDKDAPCFTYNAQKRAQPTTLGVGIVDRLGPRFCPF